MRDFSMYLEGNIRIKTLDCSRLTIPSAKHVPQDHGSIWNVGKRISRPNIQHIPTMIVEFLRQKPFTQFQSQKNPCFSGPFASADCRVASNQFQRVLNCNAYQNQPRGFSCGRVQVCPICYYKMLQLNSSMLLVQGSQASSGLQQAISSLAVIPSASREMGGLTRHGNGGCSRDW